VACHHCLGHEKVLLLAKEKIKIQSMVSTECLSFYIIIKSENHIKTFLSQGPCLYITDLEPLSQQFYKTEISSQSPLVLVLIELPFSESSKCYYLALIIVYKIR
jgi:hypothetical protein